MRSKMLGLAIALSTFGLGVAATTAWIAYHTPPAPQEIVTTRTVFVPSELPVPSNEFSPCHPNNAGPDSKMGTRDITLTADSDMLNDRAISKTAPAYPHIARTMHASGLVAVKVVIDDKSGSVVWAKAISGDPLLQQAAVQAAYNWQFVPTVSCSPSKTSGVITFNFLLQ